MKIEEIKNAIENYKNAKENLSGLEELFKKADYCDLVSKSFNKTPEVDFVLYLGVVDSKLVGFFTNENVSYEKWTSESQVFVSEFKTFTQVGFEAFEKSYSVKGIPSTKSGISGLDGINRMKLWREKKSSWFANAKKNNEIVEYFLIPSDSYTNAYGTTFNLGLVGSNEQIDLILGNSTGLYDTTCPVPPFKPTRW